MRLPYPEFDPERIVLQVACIDYRPASQIVSSMLSNIVRAVGGGPSDFDSGPPEPNFGWEFYRLSINKVIVRRLASLPDNSIMKMKGETLDQKFSVWFNRQLKVRTDKVQVRLLSELRSSQFGLF